MYEFWRCGIRQHTSTTSLKIWPGESSTCTTPKKWIHKDVDQTFFPHRKKGRCQNSTATKGRSFTAPWPPQKSWCDSDSSICSLSGYYWGWNPQPKHLNKTGSVLSLESPPTKNAHLGFSIVLYMCFPDAKNFFINPGYVKQTCFLLLSLGIFGDGNSSPWNHDESREKKPRPLRLWVRPSSCWLSRIFCGSPGGRKRCHQFQVQHRVTANWDMEKWVFATLGVSTLPVSRSWSMIPGIFWVYKYMPCILIPKGPV